MSRLEPQPVSFYATVFFLVNVTYIGLIRELVDGKSGNKASPAIRRVMRVRSLTALLVFGGAALVALRYPRASRPDCRAVGTAPAAADFATTGA